MSWIVVGLFFFFRRKRTVAQFVRLTFYGFLAALALGVLVGDAFDKFWSPVHGEPVLIRLPSNLRLFTQGLFIEGGIFFLGCALLAARIKRRFFAGTLFLLTLVTFGIGIDAFLIEPRSLVVRQLEIHSAKVTKPIRIVLASDFQADSFGAWEKDAIKRIKEQNADLILLGGDYYQFSRKSVEVENCPWNYGPKSYGRTVDLAKHLNEFLKENPLSAPLGVFAVGGTAFREPYEKENFEGTGIIYFDQTETIRISDEIKLTGLSNKTTWFAPDHVTEGLDKAEDEFRKKTSRFLTIRSLLLSATVRRSFWPNRTRTFFWRVTLMVAKFNVPDSVRF